MKKTRDKIWIKNWSGNWGMLFCSFYGLTYTKGLKKYFNKYFSNFFVQFEDGVGSNYLLSHELTNMGQHFADIVVADNKVARKWITEALARAKIIKALLSKLKKKKRLSIADYKNLKDLINNFTPFNFAIKRVVDYLPLKVQEKFLPNFEHVRIYTENIYNDVNYILLKLLKNISRKTKYSTRLLNTLTYTEVDHYTTTGKLPKLATLKERYQGMAIFYGGGKEKIISGYNFIKLKQSIIERLAKQQIKGTPAYLGIASGRVQVVLDPRKAQTFKKGDILVAGMTRPEYLSLMKKSAAFITDAGGMLSHAAIVARELKKPCIVGTEVASKILKNGDMVEVDANTGFVRKLR